MFRGALPLSFYCCYPQASPEPSLPTHGRGAPQRPAPRPGGPLRGRAALWAGAALGTPIGSLGTFPVCCRWLSLDSPRFVSKCGYLHACLHYYIIHSHVLQAPSHIRSSCQLTVVSGQLSVRSSLTGNGKLGTGNCPGRAEGCIIIGIPSRIGLPRRVLFGPKKDHHGLTGPGPGPQTRTAAFGSPTSGLYDSSGGRIV